MGAGSVVAGWFVCLADADANMAVACFGDRRLLFHHLALKVSFCTPESINSVASALGIFMKYVLYDSICFNQVYKIWNDLPQSFFQLNFWFPPQLLSCPPNIRLTLSRII